MQSTFQKRWVTLSVFYTPLFQLTFLTALSAVIYWHAFVRPADILKIYRIARPDLYQLYNAGSLVHLGLILAFVEAGLIYLLAYRLARKMYQNRAAWVLVLGGSLVFGLVFLYMFPFDAADIFDYIIHGRMTAVYGVNPYLHAPNEFLHDSFYPYVAWKFERSPYGPVWELLAGLASRVAGDGIIQNVWAYKLIPGLFYFGAVLIVARILRQTAPKDALAGTLLLAWNPVALYETWGNGHNDMVMVFFVVAAAWAVQRRRYTLAALALTAGTLVKFIPVLLFPLLGVVALRGLILRHAPSGSLGRGFWKQVARFIFITSLSVLALVAILYAPFWQGPEVVTVIQRTNLYTSSVPAALFNSIKPEMGKEEASSLVSKVALMVTLLYALLQASQAWKREGMTAFTEAAFNILAFYLLVTILWFQQWYTLWLVGLLPLVSAPGQRLLGLLFPFLALSKQLVAGPLLFWPRPTLSQPGLETRFTLGVLGIPWLVALFSVFQEKARMVLAKISGEPYG